MIRKKPVSKKAPRNHAASCSHVLIVKRRGHFERFDGKKAYASAYFACRSAHLGEAESELIAEQVLKRLCARLKSKTRVSSHEIFTAIASELKAVNDDAGFMYEHHLDIS